MPCPPLVQHNNNTPNLTEPPSSPVSPSSLSNLERKIHGSYSEDELSKMTSDCIGKGSGPLALGGSLWDDAVAGHTAKKYDDHLWDKLDAIVFKQLSDKVASGFKGSLMHEKMCQFLYLQEAVVNEDDFALFRVLGRGGFGMVNGCKKCTSGKVRACAYVRVYVRVCEYRSDGAETRLRTGAKERKRRYFHASLEAPRKEERRLLSNERRLLTKINPAISSLRSPTPQLYAMKVMNKKRVKIKRSEQLTLNERIALAAVDSPFVVNLKYAFVSELDLFLIMDLMTGGDLSFHLAQKQKFTKEEAQYYAARIMLGCQALHDEQYVYRDLKPENILMGDDGKVSEVARAPVGILPYL